MRAMFLAACITCGSIPAAHADYVATKPCSTDASNRCFRLARPVVASRTLVFLFSAMMRPDAYTISGRTLVFDGSLPPGAAATVFEVPR